MRHYCNKRNPNNNNNNRNGALNQGASETVIFPPDVDCSIYQSEEIAVANYENENSCQTDLAIGGAISQVSGMQKQVSFDMAGIESFDNKSKYSSYIDFYKQKYVCVDVWNGDDIRIFKCGFLIDIDNNTLFIRNRENNELTKINLDEVKYFSLYSK